MRLRVSPERFLMPSGEHGSRQGFDRAEVAGAEDRCLMAAFVEFANLAKPEAVGEAGAALGELEGDFLAVDEGQLERAELGGVPVRAGVFVVSEDGDAVLGPEPGEKLGGVALAVENEGEAR